MEYKSLIEVLAHYENLPFFHGYEICETLNNYMKENNITDKASNEFYENVAFWLYPNWWKNNRWTYYGPMMTLRWDDGQIYESPSISFITNDCINYREKRMNETKSIFMKNHYADVLFDLKEKICWDKSKYWEYGQNVISTVLELVNKGLIKDIYWIGKLRRAVDIAIIINADVSDLIISCINYEKAIAIDDKPWLRWFSFDILYINPKIKKHLVQEQVNDIISQLEQRIERLSKVDWNARSIKNVINRLLDYYKDNEKRTKELLLGLEQEYRKDKASNNNGLLQQNYLEEMKDLYGKYGNWKWWAKTKQEGFIKEMLWLNAKIKESMQIASTSYEISKKEMDEYVWFFFSDEGHIIPRIIVNFMPNKEKTTDFLKKLASEHPLVYIFKRKIMDDNGMPIIEIPSIEEDLESHIISQMSQDITIWEPFIWTVMDKLIAVKGMQYIVDTLKASPAFSLLKEDFLEKLLWHYYSRNYFEFSHIAIPMIEWIIRHIIEIAWWIVIMSNKYWWYDKKPFWKMIFDPILKDVFWEDFVLYNRVLFCERAWLNLRNRLSHWIDTEIFFSKNIADRIFHVILYFSILRKTDQ